MLVQSLNCAGGRLKSLSAVRRQTQAPELVSSDFKALNHHALNKKPHSTEWGLVELKRICLGG